MRPYPKRPSAYDPTKHPAASQERARLVLHTMMVQGKISPTEMSEAELNAAEIVTAETSYIDDNTLGHVFDMIAERSAGLIGSQTQDLIVRTTIDPKLQKIAPLDHQYGH